jgi:opacity protein-like surface antigen
MNKKLVIILAFCLSLVYPVISQGQGSLKFRFGANSTRFIREPGGKEVNFPLIDTLNLYKGPFTSFTHLGGLGFDAEVYGALIPNLYMGFEISDDLLTGENNNPGLYNFQYTDSLQLTATDPETDTIYIYRTNDPIKYRTTLWSFMANFRYYPLNIGRVHAFIKAGAGLSLVSTRLSLKNPSLWMTDTTLVYGKPVLFSTDRSGIVPALTFSAGIGVEVQMTSRISLYSDLSYKIVDSDLLDGRPNFNFIKETGRLERFNPWTTASKFSFGIVYTLNDNFTLFGGGRTSIKGDRGGRTSPHLPFYKLKPAD